MATPNPSNEPKGSVGAHSHTASKHASKAATGHVAAAKHASKPSGGHVAATKHASKLSSHVGAAKHSTNKQADHLRAAAAQSQVKGQSDHAGGHAGGAFLRETALGKGTGGRAGGGQQRTSAMEGLLKLRASGVS